MRAAHGCLICAVLGSHPLDHSHQVLTALLGSLGCCRAGALPDHLSAAELRTISTRAVDEVLRRRQLTLPSASPPPPPPLPSPPTPLAPTPNTERIAKLIASTFDTKMRPHSERPSEQNESLTLAKAVYLVLSLPAPQKRLPDTQKPLGPHQH